MNKGWVKLHRKFSDSPLWKYAIQMKMYHLISLWCYLLISVNYEKKKWYDGKNEIIIPVGSLMFSLQHLAEQLHLSVHQVRVALDHYERMGMMTRQVTSKWTQVWIVNWAKYQGDIKDDDTLDDSEMANKWHANDKQMATTKEYKNKRNKEITVRTVTGFGNPEINLASKYFLEKMNIPKEDCAQKESRRYWFTLLKESKRGLEGVKWLIDQASSDDWFKNNITSSKDLYYKRIKLIARKRGDAPVIAVMPEGGPHEQNMEARDRDRSVLFN